MRVRQNWYDGFDAKDNKVSIQWGKTMSDGSNLSVYFDRYDRERIRGIEDPKWSAGDLRRLLPSPDEGGLGAFNATTWRNASASSCAGTRIANVLSPAPARGETGQSG